MSGIFPQYCIWRRRQKISPYELPLHHRGISKSRYLQETLYNAWRFHQTLGNLAISDVAFRKVVYDAVYDSLTNKYGKNQHQDFLVEYQKFNTWFYENFPEEAEKLRDWDEYRGSDRYARFLAEIQQIKRLDHRASICINHALSYMYGKYSTAWKWEYAIWNLERVFKLDTVYKVWSKKWLWFATFFLFFDPMNVHARTVQHNREIIRDIDLEKAEAIKIYSSRWYEREDLDLGLEWKIAARVWKDIISVGAGEFGSVIVADAVRRGVVWSLLYLTNALTKVAMFHPALRGLKWGAEITGFLSALLSNSVVSFLGWQIAVEWNLDGFIQHWTNEAFKLIVSEVTGQNVWDYTHGKGTSWYGFEIIVQLLVKQYTSRFDPNEYQIISTYKENCHPKARDVLERIERIFQYSSKMRALVGEYRFYVERAERHVVESSYDYFSDPSLTNFLVFKTDINDYLRSLQLYNSTSTMTKFILNNFDLKNVAEVGFQNLLGYTQKILSDVLDEILVYDGEMVEDTEISDSRSVWFSKKNDDQAFAYVDWYCRYWKKESTFIWWSECVGYGRIKQVGSQQVGHSGGSKFTVALSFARHSENEDRLPDIFKLWDWLHRKRDDLYWFLLWLDREIKIHSTAGGVVVVPIVYVPTVGDSYKLFLQVRNRCMSVRKAKRVIKKHYIEGFEGWQDVRVRKDQIFSMLQRKFHWSETKKGSMVFLFFDTADINPYSFPPEGVPVHQEYSDRFGSFSSTDFLYRTWHRLYDDIYLSRYTEDSFKLFIEFSFSKYPPSKSKYLTKEYILSIGEPKSRYLSRSKRSKIVCFR